MKIVFCLPGLDYSREFLAAWSELLLVTMRHGHQVMLSQQYSSFVPFARAKCLGADVLAGPDQKPFQGEVAYDVMVWIDSDVLFTPEMIEALLDSPHPVTAAPYLMEDQKHFAAVKHWDVEYFKQHGTFEFLTPDSLQAFCDQTGGRYLPVCYSGMGLMAIKYGVVERIKYPYFSSPVIRFETGRPDVPVLLEMASEDVAFCRNLADAGVGVMLDTLLRPGHQKRVVL